MKKQIISSLLVLGMTGSALTNVAAASRTVNVLTAINYDANYLFYKTKGNKRIGAKASTQFTYNKKGLVAGEKRNWPESIFRGQRNYTYNGQNKLVKVSGYTVGYGNKKDYFKNTAAYKNGKLISLKNNFSKMKYKGNRLVSVVNFNNQNSKFSYDRKGQVIAIKDFSPLGDCNVSYKYDAKGYLKWFKGAYDDPFFYTNTYRNGLLIKQNYKYKDTDLNDSQKMVTKKGTITYTYKKIRVSNALYNKVKAQQKSLYFAGDGDYYAISFINY